ncbi:MAG: alpha/beta hydrolase [Christensenella sp.]|uniref:alpha/beta fold hydrolase n=1 Tax=Christensenella sp. TaxID=1935934 RepID=UPI002B219622|nr:alpha/beta hydrolase [Christensenella sp.]MEA5002242.1 alpha/beta hydrolase [Christensenella sp.]
MFEQISIKNFLNREHMGEYAEVEFDTYIDDRGKEEVQDVRLPIHYYEAGEGEPLIMVHGIGQSLYTWRKNFRELSEHFHVYAVDLPGHGFSGKPQMSYSIEEFALTIEAFMNVMELPAAHFCAFGESAVYVLDFAIHNPKRTKKLVLVSPMVSVGASAGRGKGLQSALGTTAGKMMLNQSAIRATLEDCYFDRTLVTPEVVNEYAAGLMDRDFKVISKMCIGNFIDDGVVANVHTLKTPMLVVLGSEDKITGGGDGEFLKLPIANGSVLTVRNCGFFVHEEKPEKVNEAVVKFCLAQKQPMTEEA